jgi:hypothetical protein
MEPLESVKDPAAVVKVPLETEGAAMFVEANVRVPLESEIVAGLSASDPTATGLAKLTEEAAVEIVEAFTVKFPSPPEAV